MEGKSQGDLLLRDLLSGSSGLPSCFEVFGRDRRRRSRLVSSSPFVRIVGITKKSRSGRRRKRRGGRTLSQRRRVASPFGAPPQQYESRLRTRDRGAGELQKSAAGLHLFFVETAFHGRHAETGEKAREKREGGRFGRRRKRRLEEEQQHHGFGGRESREARSLVRLASATCSSSGDWWSHFRVLSERERESDDPEVCCGVHLLPSCSRLRRIQGWLLVFPAGTEGRGWNESALAHRSLGAIAGE